MKKINFKAIILIISCTLFTSIGQIFLKLGADRLNLSLVGIIGNFNLILGLSFYGFGLVLLITSLKFGDLSFLYPFLALSFVWVGLLSYFFLGEPITIIKWVAIAVIIFGVSFIGIGGHHEN